LYTVNGANGLKRWTVIDPVTVGVTAFALVSRKRLLWHVSKDTVPDETVVVNVWVGTVNEVPVYSVAPLVIRILEIEPRNCSEYVGYVPTYTEDETFVLAVAPTTRRVPLR
jgi:hypothetical protein